MAPPSFLPLPYQGYLSPCALAAPWHCFWPSELQPAGPSVPPEAFDLPVGPTAEGRRVKTLGHGMWIGKRAGERTDAKVWCGNGGIVCYGRRRCERKKPTVAKTAPEAFEFVGGDGCGGRTTVMIKNVPNKYTKDMLLSMIDEHCVVENEKVRSQMGGAGKGEPVFSEFDFFYLPMDFCTGHNLGYAFVNFTSADAACRLHRAFHKKPWDLVPSPKICEITYARIQGLKALRGNFENSRFVCNSIDVLPVQFSPPRNGCKFHKCCSEFIGTMVRRTSAQEKRRKP